MKCFLLIFWFIYNFNIIKCEKQQHWLHSSMDKSELGYYFNTDFNDFNIPDYDIIDLKNLIHANHRQKRHINDIHELPQEQISLHSLKFHIFERPIHLKLKPNPNLISKNLMVWIHNENGMRQLYHDSNHKNTTSTSNDMKLNTECYFLHHDNEIVAGISSCEIGKYNGIILASNMTLELQPLNDRLHGILHSKPSEHKYESAHLIKRVQPPNIIPNPKRFIRSIEKLKNHNTSYMLNSKVLPTSAFSKLDLNNGEVRIIKKTNVRYTIELGLFFDEAAYKIFAPLFSRDDRRLAEMLLAYMNGVQALYHHNSLGNPIDVTIVHMEIMRRQPNSLPHHNGERDKLLDSFCNYQQRINPAEDEDSGHWDMGLYLSGQDFYSFDSGSNSGATMGLATVRGVCSGKYACVIVEFGTTNSFNRPYPSAGFNSVYIAAHEIGHNLGMSHDGNNNFCNKEGFVMSASRGTQGETTWSSCSSDIVRSLGSWATCLNDRPKVTPDEYDAWRYLGFPGQKWSAKRQCELLLIDKDAMPSQTNDLNSICDNLQCRSPHRSGYYYAGPALEGTDCGGNNWCEGGRCVYKQRIPTPSPVVSGGWSKWKKEKCVSGCLLKSKGAQGRRRECDSPKAINTNDGCDGSSYDKLLCSDTKICENVKRKTAVQFASRKCKQFSRKINDLDPKGVGLQAPHENHRLWMGCAIFCRRTGGSFYTPRMNLNEIGQDAYFPDGTWCHSVNNENYYCLQHHCLPEGFQFNKNSFWLLSEDVPISGNANPNLIQIYNKKLIDYLSVDENGNALRKHLSADDVHEQRGNERWIDDNDYRIIPSL